MLLSDIPGTAENGFIGIEYEPEVIPPLFAYVPEAVTD